MSCVHMQIISNLKNHWESCFQWVEGAVLFALYVIDETSEALVQF